MKTPTLEEVKEYFKDAKRVHFNGSIYKELTPCEFDLSTLEYDEDTKAYYCSEALGIDDCSDILLYDCETNKYAEIVEVFN